MSLDQPSYRLIYGANSTIGQALAERWSGEKLILVARKTAALEKKYPQANCLSFDPLVDSAQSLKDFLADKPVSLAISCVGALHGEGLSVEKSLQQLTPSMAIKSFEINTLSFATLAQALAGQLSRKRPLTLAVLSAKIGSITDNKLGGWYSYRMSKAALNMLVKDVAIEWQRKGDHKVIAIHPGTTISPFTEPFAKNIAKDKIWPAQVTAERIEHVLANSPHNGCLYNWDAEVLPF